MCECQLYAYLPVNGDAIKIVQRPRLIDKQGKLCLGSSRKACRAYTSDYKTRSELMRFSPPISYLTYEARISSPKGRKFTSKKPTDRLNQMSKPLRAEILWLFPNIYPSSDNSTLWPLSD